MSTLWLIIACVVLTDVAWLIATRARPRPAAGRRPVTPGAAAAGALLVGLVGTGAGLASGHHWSELVPRPVVSVAVRTIVASGPEVPLEELPSDRRRHGPHPLDRLVWQRRLALAVDDYRRRHLDPAAEAVPPLAAFLRDSALLAEGFHRAAGTRWSDRHAVDAAVARARRRATRAGADGRGDAARLELALITLALPATASNGVLSERVPELAGAMLESPDERVRRFAVDILGRTAGDEPRRLLRTVAEQDAAPAVATAAARWREWRAVFTLEDRPDR